MQAENTFSGGEEEEVDGDEELYASLAEKYNVNPETSLNDNQENGKQSTAEAQHYHGFNMQERKKRYDSHNTSIKPILVEYGLPDTTPERSTVSPTKKKRKKKEPAYERIGSAYNRTPTMSRQGTALDNETYENVYDDLLYKVRLQRREINERAEVLARKLEEEEKQKAKKNNEKRLQRVDLKHDGKYLKDVSKSKAYKVVKAEAELRAKGKLTTKREADEFWEAARHPQSFEEYLQRVNPKAGEEPEVTQRQERQDSELTTESTFDNSPEDSGKAAQSHVEAEFKALISDFQPMTQIKESKEPSRPQTVEEKAFRTQALTKHFQNLNAQYDIPYSALKKQEKLDPNVIARLAAAELDRKLAPPKLPSLSCFQNVAAGQDPSEEQIDYCLTAERREKKRRLFVHRIRKMHSVAQSNFAATKRMLEKQNDPEFVFGGSTLHSWFPTVGDEFHITVYSSTTELGDQEPWKKYVEHRRIRPIQEEDEFSRQTTIAGSALQNSKKMVLPPIADEKDGLTSGKEGASPSQSGGSTPILTMSELLKSSDNVLEYKGPNLYWKNKVK